MKNNTYKNKLKKWEIALLIALSFTFCTGAWAQNESARLSSSLVRLHVLAVSDDPQEQAVKLQVRDSVLAYLAPKLEGLHTRDEALSVIEDSLAGIQAAAESAADGRDVHVELGVENYPTREYEGFALPAGRYTSLRVVLGEGAGHNWWCVVFPPLCISAVSTEEALETSSEDESRLIVENDDGVSRKFKLLEIWGELVGGLTD